MRECCAAIEIVVSAFGIVIVVMVLIVVAVGGGAIDPRAFRVL